MHKTGASNKRLRLQYAWQLTKYIKGFGWYLFFATVSNLIHKVLPLVTGLVSSYMVSSVLMGQTTKVIRLMITAGILVILMALSSYLDVQIGHDMAYRILAQLRNKAYAVLDTIAPAALMGKRSGDIISIILHDIELLEWFYAHTISQLIVAVVVPLGALLFMGSLSWILPLVIIPFIIALVLVPMRSANRSDSQGTKVRETTGRLNAILVDGVQGIKDIISFRWQRQYFERFFKANTDYAEASLDYAKRKADEFRSITLMIELAAMTSNIIAVILVMRGDISVLWLLPLFILSSAIFTPIVDALTMSTNYGLIFGSAQRVLGLFASQPLVKNEGNETLDRQASRFEVNFEQVRFHYPSEHNAQDNPMILQDLSFSFSTGETVALVGPSGSGKSTVARLLQRFWDVDGGVIRINGQDIRQLQVENLRDIVTVVPQDVYLFNVSVAENIQLSYLDATEREIEMAAEQARAAEFIEKLPQGYATEIGERGLRLSGGEKQRLSIAQAFLKNSPVLVLDEASANLDAENERLINEAVQHLKQGRATLVIAHRISTIRSADRIVVLHAGSVAAQGTYSELMQSSAYFRKLMGDEYVAE